MPLRTFVTIAIAAAFAAGCSKAAGSSAAAAQTTRARAAAAPGARVTNPCDAKLVTKDDVAGILRDPIATVKSLAADGDPQTCSFETANFASVNVTVRPGLGDTTVGAWAGGRMPLHADPLAGVGDRAVWCEALKEVIATRHNVLCDVGVGGPPGDSMSGDIVRQRLGSLCNKILAKS